MESILTVLPSFVPAAVPALADAPDASPNLLRHAMRALAGGVCVVTTRAGSARAGLTITSAQSFALEPPTMLVCINQNASAVPLLQKSGVFCVNVLADHQSAIADRFAGRGGEKGEARFAGAHWFDLATGAPALSGALAAVDCRISDWIVRHTHILVLGQVVALHNAPTMDGTSASPAPLVYVNGGYASLKS